MKKNPHNSINQEQVELTSKAQASTEEAMATLLSRLPSKTLQKLFIAEHQAQIAGDHRPILDPAKLAALLQLDPFSQKTSPAFLDSIKAQLKHTLDTGDEPLDRRGFLTQPEKLADLILDLAGIGGRMRGLMNDELRAQYPDMNKATLVKMGARNLVSMLRAFYKSFRLDNLTSIAKFQSYMKQIAAGEEPGLKPMQENEAFIKNSFKEGSK